MTLDFDQCLKEIQFQYQLLESQNLKFKELSESEKREKFPAAYTNLPKNRYSDVLPSESTRVRLKLIDNLEGSDYINANYLLGSKYISCQAPLLNTFADFWRMIWEQNSLIIVMLTKLMENGKLKAQVYWPSKIMGNIVFGGISVTLLSEEISESFTIRNIQMTKDNETRTVHHLHYTDWPDFGIPICTKGIRDLCETVNCLVKSASNDSSPIVVHCSAGLGRSGSFIAIHYSLKKLIIESSSLNIPDLISEMRRDRIGMVQTEKQYEFIYKAISEQYPQLEFKDVSRMYVQIR